VTSRKPAFVRWAEEAEAKQVLGWAGVEQATEQSNVCVMPLRRPRKPRSLLRRLRRLLANDTLQIARDD
jgi:hypothetical protein